MFVWGDVRVLIKPMGGMSQGYSFCVHVLNPSLHFDIGRIPALVVHMTPEGEH
jgi:hypothetical protein